MKENHTQITFNRGLVSKLALARQDVKRVGLSADLHTNWMPRILGSMMLRPGTEYIGTTNSNALSRHLEFIFAIDDTAVIELIANVMRVRLSDSIIQRSSVSTAVTNGLFTTDLTGWTDSDEAVQLPHG